MITVEIIKQMLKDKGITQTKFLNDLELSSSTLTDWKAKRGKPSAETILKIAEYFNVSTDYLLMGKENSFNEELGLDHETVEYLRELQTRPESKIWFNLIHNVSKEELEKFVAVIEAMKGKK